MRLIKLFARDNVKCPEWLSDEEIDDSWRFALYFKTVDSHNWRLDNSFGYSLIIFNNSNYIIESYDENGDCIFIKEIDENTVSIT